LPAQSFSVSSSLVLDTIYYCLRFVTSIFVASKPVQVQVQVTLRLTVSQSVSLGVEPRLLLLLNVTVLFFVGRPL
jgi:hypothetical protein